MGVFGYCLRFKPGAREREGRRLFAEGRSGRQSIVFGLFCLRNWNPNHAPEATAGVCSGQMDKQTIGIGNGQQMLPKTKGFKWESKTTSFSLIPSALLSCLISSLSIVDALQFFFWVHVLVAVARGSPCSLRKRDTYS